MKFLMIAQMPHKTFNAAVRDGSADSKLQSILADIKPESVYFTELDGRRSAVMIVEMDKTSRIPSLAEPWFLTFDADVRFHPVMEPKDLEQGNLKELSQKWG